ncbi:MAG: NAD(P)/FAD-dependent oxidoreductase [Thermocrispum sp.]
MRVTVVGGGVIGLSCALRLAQRGHGVTVLTGHDVAQTTSAVAGGLVYPRFAEPAQRTFDWTNRSYTAFRRLSGQPDTGVRMLPGRILRRVPKRIPSWSPAVGGVRRQTDLPPPWQDAVSFTPPLVHMARYLRWLAGQAAAAGVRVERRMVDALPVAEADVVVNAAGLGAGMLAGDDSVIPARGQLVHVADSELDTWVVDEDNFSYVLPHGDHLVCGGTEEPGNDSLEPDPATTADILRRCAQLVPEVAGAEVLGVRVGLRPYRPEIRLERVGSIVHCYGHGGVGVTVSWGCADEVADLVGE